MAGTVSLFAVDLDAVVQAWRARPLSELVAATPRGSLAALLERSLGGFHVDRKLPAARALAGAPAAEQRDLYDALVEDAALASLWDAPEDAFAEVLAALVRLSKDPGFGLEAAQAAPFVYPADLTEEPFVDHVEVRAGMLQLHSDPERLAAGRAAARRALELPPGAFPGEDPALWQDLLEAVCALFDAGASPGVSIVAQRSGS